MGWSVGAMLLVSSVAVLACSSTGQVRGSARPADRIVVRKAARELVLWRRGEVLARYRVALGSSPVGPKRQEGDGRTPEGVYRIRAIQEKSVYHLGLRLSYPSPADVAQARRRGVAPGGAILIHGLPRRFAWLGPLHRLRDWTRGCIAVTNEEIEAIRRAVRVGCEVEILP